MSSGRIRRPPIGGGPRRARIPEQPCPDNPQHRCISKRLKSHCRPPPSQTFVTPEGDIRIVSASITPSRVPYAQCQQRTMRPSHVHVPSKLAPGMPPYNRVKGSSAPRLQASSQPEGRAPGPPFHVFLPPSSPLSPSPAPSSASSSYLNPSAPPCRLPHPTYHQGAPNPQLVLPSPGTPLRHWHRKPAHLPLDKIQAIRAATHGSVSVSAKQGWVGKNKDESATPPKALTYVRRTPSTKPAKGTGSVR